MKKSAHWPLMLPPSLQERRLLCAPSLPRNWCKFPQPRKQAGPGQPTKDHTDGPSPAAYLGGRPRASNHPTSGACPSTSGSPLWWRRPGFHAFGHPSSLPPLPSGPAASEPAPAPAPQPRPEDIGYQPQ